MKSTKRVLFVAAGADAGGAGALGGAFDVDVAEGAVDAMKRLSGGSAAPHCVVVHTGLPDLSLAAFLERVGRAAPDAATVVVGELPADPEVATALVEADAYVPPGRERTLVERVRRVLDDRRIDQAIDRHDRLARVVAAVAGAVAGAPDRESVEATVYDHLMEGDVYRQVWVARVGDGEVDVVVPVGGRFVESDLQDLTGAQDSSAVSRAVRGGHVVATGGRAPTRGASATAATRTPRGGETDGLASAIVPFVHDGRVSGLGVVSTTLVDAFDASERELLADLGAVAGHALAGVESGNGTAPTEGAAGMGTLVHELRNPLGIARSHLELAREDGDEGSLEQVESALDRMVDTIDRVASGVGAAQSVEETAVDLESAAEDAWEALPAASASLDVVDSPGLRADREMTVRMLANLFQNAIDHGGESVTVRVGTTPDGFFVEDDGPGIPPGDRESVLERGYTTAEDGLGLGLSIVQAVVEAHGWTLSVSESGDGGARFEVSGVELAEDGPVEGNEHA